MACWGADQPYGGHTVSEHGDALAAARARILTAENKVGWLIGQIHNWRASLSNGGGTGHVIADMDRALELIRSKS